MIAIVDYGLSNLTCVVSACRRLGFDPQVVTTGDQIGDASKVILPGVGAFGDAMANLSERGFVGPLDDAVLRERKPFLGICLGAQLICRSSDEFGRHEGLGWIDADVQRIDTRGESLRVPHSGWDDIEIIRDCALLADIEPGSLFYYTHSHAVYANDEQVVSAYCVYGAEFVSIMCKDNVFATQFHPEKSQKMGLKLLDNFLSLA